MKYKSVTNLKYANFQGTKINCLVDFEEIGVIPFTASENDLPHSVEIFRRAKIGNFGRIEPYVSEVNNNYNVNLTEIQRDKRNKLLENLDIYLSNPLRWASFSEELKNDFATYRLNLLNVPQQPGFPETIDWPTPPDEYIEPVLLTGINFQVPKNIKIMQ